MFLFNVSTDDVELSPRGVLEDHDESEVNIGDFFDAADRDYLRLNESFLLNNESNLLPSLVIEDSLDQLDDSLSDFDANGSPSVFFSSTPLRDDLPDLFAVGSPVLSTPSSGEMPFSDLDDASFKNELMIRSRGRPNRIIYTESDSSSSPTDYNYKVSPWTNREIKCMKYVDDCLSLEKINFKVSKVGTDSYVRAKKSQNHMNTV